ncbi:MAG: glycosyltransferase family 4 protein [Clostridiaceae bacterium]|nr:glycosyltransferase family 4 protein [Clostridiaceae bacterium]
MKRALMYASVASIIDVFNKNNIKILQELGYTVDIACNFQEGSMTSDERVAKFQKELENDEISYFDIPIPRSVTKWKVIMEVYQITKKIVKNNYQIVHCHSPIGAAICRWAFRKSNTKVIYTAHGFHFYSGAPLINWLVYYPIERLLAKYTDILITINKEDYQRAKSFSCKKVEYIPGVGVDTYHIENLQVDKIMKRKELGLSESDIVLISVGELNDNKNQKVIIEALNLLNNKNVKYVICGKGINENMLKASVSSYNLGDQVYFLGFRNDIYELLKMSDIFVFPSYREGLSLSLIEAKTAGLPCVVSDIRGNRDLIVNDQEGYLVDPDNIEGFAKKIKELITDRTLMQRFGNNNKQGVQEYSSSYVNNIMWSIYKEIL